MLFLQGLGLLELPMQTSDIDTTFPRERVRRNNMTRQRDRAEERERRVPLWIKWPIKYKCCIYMVATFISEERTLKWDGKGIFKTK